MSTALTLANTQVPAHLAARIGAPSALSQSLGSGLSTGESTARISIKGSRFRIVEGGTETVLDATTIDVVVVGANPRLSKTWYAKPWDKDAEPTSPDCFSLDGVGPDAQSTAPQNDLCASCPQNAWGSKLTPQGKQIKACSDQKRLAVVSADDPSGAVYLLQVTPAALLGLGKYQKELSMRGIPAEIVRTRISFDTDASYPKLKFDFGGFLDANTQHEVDQLFGSEQVLQITGELRTSTPVVPKIAAPAAVKPAPVVVPQPEPEPAPAKRGFGAAKKAAAAPAAPAAAPSAASLADEIAALVEGANSDD